MRGLYIICTFAFAFYSGWHAAISADARWGRVTDAPLLPLITAAAFAMAALHAP